MVMIVSHFLFLDLFWSISCGDVLIINLIIRRDYKNINLLLVTDITLIIAAYRKVWAGLYPKEGRHGVGFDLIVPVGRLDTCS